MGEEIRYISLFSGVEACSVAWYHMKNWQAVAFAEFDEFPSAVLKYQFPHVPNVGDVTKHEWKQYKGKCELIVGGSPCQSFSVAGKRLGLDDPRGNLALHFLRVVDDIRPKWFIFENVPGILSSDNGRDFATFLAEVERIGYGVAYRILDAQHFGVPQRRRRLFVVGHIDGDWRSASAVLFEPEGLSRNPPTRPTQREEATSDIGESPSQRGEYWNGRGIADTLTTRADNQRMPDKAHFNGVIVPKVSSTLSKLDDATWGSNQWVDQNKAIIHPRVTGTLDTELNTKLSTQAAQSGFLVASQHPDDVAPTVTAKWSKGADTVPGGKIDNGNMIPVSLPKTDEPMCFDHTFGQNYGIYNEVSPTLKVNGVVPTSPAVTQQPIGVDLFNQEETGEVHVPLRTAQGHGAPAVMTNEPIPIQDQATRFAGNNNGKAIGKGNGLGVGEPGQPVHTLTRNDRHAVFSDLVVRRLTPVECERLQGFPDNWTQIPFKGKPKEQCPDGHRFKAMGNSMAVPVMRWIGEGIELVNRIPREGEVPQQQELGWL